MKTLVSIAAAILIMVSANGQELKHSGSQGQQDTSSFTKAKTAIAKRVVEQMKARLTMCENQPKSKQALCAEWADASNKAATDIEMTAFAEIDKLMAPR